MTLGAGLLAGGALLVAPQLLPQAFASCPGVEVVFARGTDEPPGVGKVGGAFVNSLRQQTGKSVGTYGVNYPANKDFLAAADGANDASNHIQQMAGNCPNTKLVLGGYSQGAAVIDIVTAAPLPGLGFRQPLPAAAADHVAAVALFGNPSGRAAQLMSALTPEFGGKTIDLCNPGDPICSGGNQWASHLSYVPGLTNKAANFVATKV
ncbi:cutinase [Mycobacterium nebraskense]|uniref:cutinase family protein n=1 Tax=Mycobacterium nebraskense TaxID=244292 RepID=UPI0006424316|nr:cutinase family protein [Mycobacterium nebraskense]KLO43413.1 cutinase [Mycobacterium nebraskense]